MFADACQLHRLSLRCSSQHDIIGSPSKQADFLPGSSSSFVGIGLTLAEEWLGLLSRPQYLTSSLHSNLKKQRNGRVPDGQGGTNLQNLHYTSKSFSAIGDPSPPKRGNSFLPMARQAEFRHGSGSKARLMEFKCTQIDPV
jgi:hypothetical protein